MKKKVAEAIWSELGLTAIPILCPCLCIMWRGKR